MWWGTITGFLISVIIGIGIIAAFYATASTIMSEVRADQGRTCVLACIKPLSVWRAWRRLLASRREAHHRLVDPGPPPRGPPPPPPPDRMAS